MKFSRCLGAMLAAMVCLALVCADSGAFPGRRGGVPSPDYGYGHWYAQGYPYYNPYIAPLPGYGILPLPLTTIYGYDVPNYYTPGRTDLYGGRGYAGVPELDYIPRKRPTL